MLRKFKSLTKKINITKCFSDYFMKADNSLFKRINTSHQYPFCWRSDTPLIYKAVPSWFIEVTKIKDAMISNCNETYWVPDHVKTKRFSKVWVSLKGWGKVFRWMHVFRR